jgi:uncharacterized protein (DUF433 family)
MRYLGAGAPKPVAYGTAAVSGTVLAVCSCTVLPLFSGIHRMGAGLGPATAFFSGPAIIVLAIVLTASVLGWQLGLARAVGAVLFAVVVGLLMPGSPGAGLCYRWTMTELLDRITVDPEQCGGRPCIRGMRIRVIDVLDLLANGLTPDEVLEDLPDLQREDILAALKFAARRLDHPVIAA